MQVVDDLQKAPTFEKVVLTVQLLKFIVISLLFCKLDCHYLYFELFPTDTM